MACLGNQASVQVLNQNPPKPSKSYTSYTNFEDVVADFISLKMYIFCLKRIFSPKMERVIIQLRRIAMQPYTPNPQNPN